MPSLLLWVALKVLGWAALEVMSLDLVVVLLERTASRLLCRVALQVMSLDLLVGRVPLVLHPFLQVREVYRWPQDGESERIFPRMAEADPYPSAGSAAAQVAAAAASVAASAADRSRAEWNEAGGAHAQALALRSRALGLGERGASAYAAARTVLASRQPEADPEPDREAGAEDQRTRDWRLGMAVERAAGPPLELAATAADIAQLAATIAAHGSVDARADAAVAAVLAAAAARAAEQLVRVNLVVGDQEAGLLARGHAEAAAAAAASVDTLEP